MTWNPLNDKVVMATQSFRDRRGRRSMTYAAGLAKQVTLYFIITQYLE